MSGYTIITIPASKYNYTRGRTRELGWIVIHYTGAKGSALANGKYFAQPGRAASAHYFVDDMTIVRSVDDADTAWAVGAWAGTTAYVTNPESISIEVVSDGEDFSSAERDRLRWLVLKLMREHGIDADHVVRHYDCHSGHKCCPEPYCPNGGDPTGDKWRELHGYITTAEPAPQIGECIMVFACQPDGKDYMVWYDGNQIHGLEHPDELAAVEMAYAKATGEALPMFEMGTAEAPWFARFADAVSHPCPSELVGQFAD